MLRWYPWRQQVSVIPSNCNYKPTFLFGQIFLRDIYGLKINEKCMCTYKALNIFRFSRTDMAGQVTKQENVVRLNQGQWLGAQCMISKSNVKLYSLWWCVCRYFLQKNLACDNGNNQVLGKCSHCCYPRPSARLITLTSTLISPDITKKL